LFLLFFFFLYVSSVCISRARRAKHDDDMSGRDVPWYRGGSKDRKKYDGIMNMSPLEEQRMEIERNRRIQDEQTAQKYWATEDALLEKVRAMGLQYSDKDEFGLPMDVSRVMNEAADALNSALSEKTDGGKLISMKLAVDPMPWWEFADHTIPVGIARVLKEKSGLGKVAIIPPTGKDISDQPIETLALGDIDSADVVYVMNPDCSSEEKINELMAMAGKTKNKDVIVVDGNFGEPGSMEGKKIRSAAKKYFGGGVQSISFVMEPVRLVRNVGGDPYPLPQWLKDSGYKATGNLAVTGNSGTGKSSLNNAMRGLKARDNGAAEVGVKETTINPTPYTITVEGNTMQMYDLPGAGTPKFPLETYIRSMGIKYFDLVIVASAGRFTETDLELMDELRRNGVPFFALRTKIDLEISNAAHDSGATAEETIDTIRKDLEYYTLLPPERIYMVSARKPEDYDFERLKSDTEKAITRALDVKLAKALTRKLEVQGVWNAV